MTDEQRKQVDELIRIASAPGDLTDYEAMDRCATYLADLRCSTIAIAIMLRDLLDRTAVKPEPAPVIEPWQCTYCGTAANLFHTCSYCDAAKSLADVKLKLGNKSA